MSLLILTEVPFRSSPHSWAWLFLLSTFRRFFWKHLNMDSLQLPKSLSRIPSRIRDLAHSDCETWSLKGYKSTGGFFYKMSSCKLGSRFHFITCCLQQQKYILIYISVPQVHFTRLWRTHAKIEMFLVKFPPFFIKMFLIHTSEDARLSTTRP